MFTTIESAIKAYAAGEFLVVMDDENRENEGDLMIAAEKVTTEKINFMIQKAKGLICMPLLGSRLRELEIAPMVENQTCGGAAFTVTIDHVDSGTGVSAASRALTIKKALEDCAAPEDFNRPGHIFPLWACDGGVLEREGHTEASIDLCRLSGLKPAAVLCEILNEDGTMARYDDLKKFSKEHDIEMINIKDLKEYILHNK